MNLLAASASCFGPGGRGGVGSQGTRFARQGGDSLPSHGGGSGDPAPDVDYIRAAGAAGTGHRVQAGPSSVFLEGYMTIRSSQWEPQEWTLMVTRPGMDQ